MPTRYPMTNSCCAPAGYNLHVMNQTYTAAIKHVAPWWIGWIEEVPGVNCQESSRKALLESLRVTLKEALAMNREDALSAAGGGYEEHPVAV